MSDPTSTPGSPNTTGSSTPGTATTHSPNAGTTGATASGSPTHDTTAGGSPTPGSAPAHSTNAGTTGADATSASADTAASAGAGNSGAGAASVTYVVDAGVATITLNRPDAMNALDTPTKILLRDTVRAAADDPGVRVVVLTGTGRAFCVGQDLKEHIGLLQANDQAALWSTVPDHYTPIALALAEMPKPVIAAVNGVAAGAGASMAFACDFRIVADTAGFNLAFTGIALSCDTGISWTLPRLIGHAKALELLYFPRTVPAAEALDLGLATTVVPSADLATAVSDLANKLAQGPTIAYGAVRRSLNYSATHTLAESLSFEATQMQLTGATEDHHNAVTSFVTKQNPTFTGH
ncbi:enoyl-CoA hydratase-related protein [Kribbella solani]|uniref:enoyl-CoA hydratase/isomerase family protein n=1 Tax=Kribbella solani TaxID=236067 RepID=UPI0029A4AA90|nr:enoyl-CoA hydratase-related protein [Kribbella solani]MDX3002815.1 enoyl-CoA hydratase-related protein [Kribbella solani]